MILQSILGYSKLRGILALYPCKHLKGRKPFLFTGKVNKMILRKFLPVSLREQSSSTGKDHPKHEILPATTS